MDAALDIAGPGIIPELIEIVGNASRVLSVADFSAPQYGAKFSYGPPEDLQRKLADMARLYSKGILRLHIERTFPLAQTREAEELSAKGHVTRQDHHLCRLSRGARFEPEHTRDRC